MGFGSRGSGGLSKVLPLLHREESFTTIDKTSSRNAILDENNELRNRDMLVGAALTNSNLQSINKNPSKCQIDTLNCTLEELAVLRAIEDNPKITQTEIAKTIKKSASTVKRITSALVEKGIIIRRNGRRNGWWEINQNEL